MKYTHTTKSGNELRIEDSTLITPRGQITLLQSPPVPVFGPYLQGLKKAGHNPADYMMFGCQALDIESAVWVAEHVARVEAENKAYRARPEVKERRRVCDLFAKAERMIDYPGSYFPAIDSAEAAYQAWRISYPEAAKEEDRQSLISEAEHQESLALGALTFDMDGWLSSEDQERRSAEFKAKATQLREKAALLMQGGRS